MSFTGLLDLTAEVWRGVPGEQDADGVLNEGLALVGSVACTLSITPAGARRRGGAELPAQTALIFAQVTDDVRQEDVLVFRGTVPSEVTAWRVLGAPSYPRQHHLEANVTAWDGEVPYP